MICLVTDFFGCVYNEYIILSCCGLEVDTIDEIIVRSTCLENIPLYNINNLDNEDNDDIIKKKENKKDNNHKIDEDVDIGDDENIISVGSYKFNV